VFKTGSVVFLLLFSILFFSNSVVFASDSPEVSSAIPDIRKFELNTKINPCDDFHAYVCSNVEGQFKLRDDRSSHTFAFDDSDERILEKKKDFFKNIDKEKKLSARSQQLKDFYKACMNEPESKKEELKLVQQLKSEVAGIKTIEQFEKINRENLTNEKWGVIGYEILPNTDDPTIYDVTFDVAFMGLPEHSYYDNKQLVDAYANLIADFFNTIYPNEDKAEHLKRAQAVIDFEKRFKEVYPFPAEFRQRYTQPRRISREDFLKKTSALNLQSFFDKNIPEKTLVRDFIPESLDFLQKEMKTENLQVLKDMYTYRNAREFMDDAYPELFQKRMDFRHQFLGGPLTRPDRQERCTESVMGAFGRELDYEMLPRLFADFPKEKMRLVAEKIRTSILTGIEKNTWLTAQSKKGALEKIRTAKLQLVQPIKDKEWDFKDILKLSSKYPYANALKLTMAGHKRTFKKLREGVNQEAWGMGPLTVNAYYSADKNKFVMPIGILQYPFFIKDGDVIENLGAVGAVIGHEIGHSIDDQGSKFDSTGKLKQWMAEEDIKKFQERGKKMIEQFNKIGHNGYLTQGENIADLVGLTFAYNAAFPEQKGSEEDKKKFFVAYGRLWCNVTREKAQEMQLKTDPHSLGYARINEQVKHQTGFQEAFSCNRNNKLYLDEADRIQIW
jgi:putative endopeptidase